MDLSQLSPWVLTLAIFLARILDVSLATLRMIVVIRGYRFVAAVLGFFEVLIWLVAVGQVIQNLDVWYLAVAYAGGFAAGNVVGIWLESKLAMGTELVRVVSERPDVALAGALRAEGYSVIEMGGRGDRDEPVEVLLIVDRRRRIPRALRLIRELDPDAFWTVTDVKRRVEDTYPGTRRTFALPSWTRSARK